MICHNKFPMVLPYKVAGFTAPIPRFLTQDGFGMTNSLILIGCHSEGAQTENMIKTRFFAALRMTITLIKRHTAPNDKSNDYFIIGILIPCRFAAAIASDSPHPRGARRPCPDRWSARAPGVWPPRACRRPRSPARVLAVADAHAAAVMERHPGGAAHGIDQRVQDRPVADGIGAVAHAFGFAVG